MSNRFAQILRDLHWISLADRRAKEFKTLTRLKTLVNKRVLAYLFVEET